MPRIITQRELRNESGEVMRALDAGESFVVTRNGIAVGELRPVRRNQFVSKSTVLAAFERAARVDPELLRRELDGLVDQDPNPRA